MSDPPEPGPGPPVPEERPDPATVHEEERSGGPSSAVVGVVVGVLVFVAIVLAVILLGGGDPDEQAGDVGSPLPTGTDVAPGPDDDGADGPEEPDAEPTAGDLGEREPTDEDAAEFTGRYEPPGASATEAVTADLNGDGRAEVVVASIAGHAVRLDVAVWTGQRYEVAFTDQGGPADTIDSFVVRDLTDSGLPEIVTVQSSGEEGQSLSLWGWDGSGVARQRARGGCWDGSHTYGIVGAELRDGEVVATCDGSPLPASAWTSDVYAWDGEAWAHVRTEEP